MISGRLPAVKKLARAIDLEGQNVAEEETGNIGARHRSAYLSITHKSLMDFPTEVNIG